MGLTGLAIFKELPKKTVVNVEFQPVSHLLWHWQQGKLPWNPAHT